MSTTALEPGTGYATLALLVGVGFIANGASMLMLGFGLRRIEPAA